MTQARQHAHKLIDQLPEMQVNALVGTGAMVEVMANHPAATDFYAEEFYSPFSYNKRDGMLVDVRLKELFRFKMGHRHGCFTCNSGNWNTAQEYGFTPEQQFFLA